MRRFIFLSSSTEKNPNSIQILRNIFLELLMQVQREILGKELSNNIDLTRYFILPVLEFRLAVVQFLILNIIEIFRWQICELTMKAFNGYCHSMLASFDLW